MQSGRHANSVSQSRNKAKLGQDVTGLCANIQQNRLEITSKCFTDQFLFTPIYKRLDFQNKSLASQPSKSQRSPFHSCSYESYSKRFHRSDGHYSQSRKTSTLTSHSSHNRRDATYPSDDKIQVQAAEMDTRSDYAVLQHIEGWNKLALELQQRIMQEMLSGFWPPKSLD